MEKAKGPVQISEDLRDTVIRCIFSAGEAVMKVYSTDFGVEMKQDNTPITEADRAADGIIRSCLDNLPVNLGGEKEQILPFLSEEGKEIPYETRAAWKTYWLVDPLDGTKEFVSRNGEFTINIALIEKTSAGGPSEESGTEFLPAAGFVYLPVLRTLYWGIYGQGSFRLEIPAGWTGKESEEVPRTALLSANRQPLRLPASPAAGGTHTGGGPLRIVASRSHLDPKTEEYIDAVRSAASGKVELVQAGSSLKLCRIAEGNADLYPRFGPTMEWDIAAGHGVCRAAGCRVIDLHSGRELGYNKASLKNGHFLAGTAEVIRKYSPTGLSI